MSEIVKVEQADCDLWHELISLNEWNALHRPLGAPLRDPMQLIARHRLAERERCARVADEAKRKSEKERDSAWSGDIDWYWGAKSCAEEIATAIRQDDAA